MTSDHAEAGTGDVDADLTIRQIGQLVRHLRQTRGLTLKQLATRTGISISMLSMLERGMANASVSTLVSVASALQVPLSELFTATDDEDPGPVVRDADRTFSTDRPGVHSTTLLHDHQVRLDLAVDLYDPHSGNTDERASRHEGREFGYVLEGELSVEVDGETWTLGPGDSIRYDSTVPHRIANPTGSPVRVLWLNID